MLSLSKSGLSESKKKALEVVWGSSFSDFTSLLRTPWCFLLHVIWDDSWSYPVSCQWEGGRVGVSTFCFPMCPLHLCPFHLYPLDLHSNFVGQNAAIRLLRALRKPRNCSSSSEKPNFTNSINTRKEEQIGSWVNQWFLPHLAVRCWRMCSHWDREFLLLFPLGN